MRALFSLFRLFTLRELLSSRGRPLLTIFGIALGISVYLAIRLANSHALASFATTLDAVAGKATLQVSAGDLGFDEMLFLKVKGTPGVLHAAPVVQATALVKGKEGAALLVLGVDTFSEEFIREYDFNTAGERKLTLSMLSEPDTIFITERMARGQGIKAGDRLVLLTDAKARPFRVRGLLRERGAALAFGGNLAVMDIAAAQEAFQRLGRLDRIDIIPAPGVRLEVLQERLKAVLPPHLSVERPVRRNARVDEMLSSFRLNLSVLSFIALLVGLFLVYNTMSTAVVRRRREIGILRALGVTSREILLLFSLEAASLGLAGSALGVILGYLFARGALEAVSKTVSLLCLHRSHLGRPFPSRHGRSARSGDPRGAACGSHSGEGGGQGPSAGEYGGGLPLAQDRRPSHGPLPWRRCPPSHLSSAISGKAHRGNTPHGLSGGTLSPHGPCPSYAPCRGAHLARGDIPIFGGHPPYGLHGGP